MSAERAGSAPATQRVVERVLASRPYRAVDAGLVQRLAGEELRRRASEAEAVKAVKRRLHQAVGAYRSSVEGKAGMDDLSPLRAAWHGDVHDQSFTAGCRNLLRRHASTRERLPYLDEFFAGIWEAAGGLPSSLLDLGCGLGPLALPWMNVAPTTTIHAIDVDNTQLATVDAFLSLVGQPHAVQPLDLAAKAPTTSADIALLLKLVPLLDRQDPGAATRLGAGLHVRRAAISFPRHSLGGRGKGMERTYRERLDRLVSDLGERVADVRETSVPNELVFVLGLQPTVDG